MRVVLRLEQLGKAFRLGEIGRRVFFQDWRRKLITHENLEDDPSVYWALRDISFEVREGEVVGLLGAARPRRKAGRRSRVTQRQGRAGPAPSTARAPGAFPHE